MSRLHSGGTIKTVETKLGKVFCQLYLCYLQIILYLFIYFEFQEDPAISLYFSQSQACVLMLFTPVCFSYLMK